jgi:hypothetical protein
MAASVRLARANDKRRAGRARERRRWYASIVLPAEPEKRLARLLRGPERVVIRQQRARLLARILEFARLTIDDVVNDPRAKIRVLGLYRVADACEWETCRTILRERVARTAWERENR